jgi:NADH dehydrogenase/NADH:ubiquinone oxidoreductase subunit G
MANTMDDVSSYIRIDKEKCINCDRCVKTCSYFNDIGVFGYLKDEATGHIVSHVGNMLVNECIQCGQCINRCPSGALYEENEID